MPNHESGKLYVGGEVVLEPPKTKYHGYKAIMDRIVKLRKEFNSLYLEKRDIIDKFKKINAELNEELDKLVEYCER